MLGSYLMWAGVLFAQNYSFTYVSRARNSGSLVRHFKAAIFSNGIWIVSNMIMLGTMFDSLTGKHGLRVQILSGLVYTVATVAGSLTAHFVSKKTEKGKNAVGASDRYVQITKEEWADVQKLVAEVKDAPEGCQIGFFDRHAADTLNDVIQGWRRVKQLAEQSYDITVGLIPETAKVGK